MAPTTLASALKDLFRESGRVFTSPEVLQAFGERYPGKWKEGSVRAHLYACSVNNPGGYKSHPSLEKFLFSLGSGRYELYDDGKHGVWELGYPEGDLPVEESETIPRMTFEFERDLEEYLVQNLSQLEEGLTLVDEHGRLGRQVSTPVGRMDILAQDAHGNPVVIELKAGVAGDQALGQILRYVGWLRREEDEAVEVRGIIVSDDFDEGVKVAVSALPYIQLKRYVVEFRFEDVA